MTKIKAGYYSLEGNLVIYEGGSMGYDIDSASYIPAEVLVVMGEYLCSIEEGNEKYGY